MSENLVLHLTISKNNTKGALGPKGRFYRSTLCGAYSSEASLKKAKRLKDCPLLYYFVTNRRDDRQDRRDRIRRRFRRYMMTRKLMCRCLRSRQLTSFR